MSGFRSWLTQFVQVNSAVGDLARDVAADPDWLEGSDELGDLRRPPPRDRNTPARGDHSTWPSSGRGASGTPPLARGPHLGGNRRKPSARTTPARAGTALPDLRR